jgi:hypothetical protein
MLSDLQMSWKPFGLTLTYEEFTELVAWYIQKNAADTLDNKEEQGYANKLYPQKLDSWTY